MPEQVRYSSGEVDQDIADALRLCHSAQAMAQRFAAVLSQCPRGWLPESKGGQEFRRRVWSCRARNVCFMTRHSCCEMLS